jgi:hypothetical protein
MNQPSGNITFLLTDSEGSTRRWEADPEAMHVALAMHDEVRLHEAAIRRPRKTHVERHRVVGQHDRCGATEDDPATTG